MKYSLYLTLLALLVFSSSYAQDQKPASPEETVTGSIGGNSVTIVYCKPSARGRKIMGGLVPYGEVWRTGANAATTIEFTKAAKIEGKELPAGKYELFTIPGENEWVVIFQKYGKQWGHYSYKKENDVLRVTVKPEKTKEFVETFKITVEKNDINMKWENTSVSFNVKA
ncbi:MAG TPA: DUF2911 domain-containing protein [Cyclobacteriaceae bacterium]|nr:DUF2911 domain-containing protein [Cyclobacteriaceae bacterium]